MKANALTIGGCEVAFDRDMHEHDDRFAPVCDAISRQTNPWDTTVLDLFSTAVHRTPNSVALADTELTLTFAELWNYADAFRSRLVAQGTNPGDRVGVAAGRSTATVAAILGVVMAGGCYVPVEMKEFSAAVLGQIMIRVGFATGWRMRRPGRSPIPRFGRDLPF